MRLNWNTNIHGWALIGAVGVISLAMTLIEQNLGELFRYERVAILKGQLWRLISGHLVHANFTHWFMNMVALGVMYLLFPAVLHGRRAILFLFSLCLMISLGCMMFYPQLDWFVGLSGVLHGMFLVGALKVVATSRVYGGSLLVMLMIKLVYEQLEVGGGLSSSMLGLDVVVQVHLLGVVSGGGWYLLYQCASAKNVKQRQGK